MVPSEVTPGGGATNPGFWLSVPLVELAAGPPLPPTSSAPSRACSRPPLATFHRPSASRAPDTTTNELNAHVTTVSTVVVKLSIWPMLSPLQAARRRIEASDLSS